MIETLQYKLFKLNEALHQSQIIPDDKFVSIKVLMFAIIGVLTLMPSIIRMLDYLYALDPKYRYIPFIIIGFLLLFLLFFQAYWAILFSVLFMIFYHIINLYPKNENIKKFIDRLF